VYFYLVLVLCNSILVSLTFSKFNNILKESIWTIGWKELSILLNNTLVFFHYSILTFNFKLLLFLLFVSFTSMNLSILSCSCSHSSIFLFLFFNLSLFFSNCIKICFSTWEFHLYFFQSCNICISNPWWCLNIFHWWSLRGIKCEHSIDQVFKVITEEVGTVWLVLWMCFPKQISSVCTEESIEWIWGFCSCERWVLGKHNEEDYTSCKEIYWSTWIWFSHMNFWSHIAFGT